MGYKLLFRIIFKIKKNIISGNTVYEENAQCNIKIDGKTDILDLIKLKKPVAEKA